MTFTDDATLWLPIAVVLYLLHFQSFDSQLIKNIFIINNRRIVICQAIVIIWMHLDGCNICACVLFYTRLHGHDHGAFPSVILYQNVIYLKTGILPLDFHLRMMCVLFTFVSF